MKVLLDTDVMVDYLRRHPASVAWVEAHVGQMAVAAMTVAELYQGVRDGEETWMLKRTLAALEILPQDAEISERGGLFSRKWKKSHGCGLADCLIAATAEIHGLTLTTFNAKHYPMLKKVQAPYKR